ncbi:MAG: hypothetical protein HC890_00615 [Chloroflexaceae bacterium]|nr:hypothetical protein [Chloroflexaceae bacterium]
MEAGAGLGDNRLYGGAGNDELIAGAAGGDRLFGNNGDDVLDSSLSLGENRLYGGNGDDVLIAGLGDRLIGGSGSDRLFAMLGGDNTLTGGRGNDQFWLGGIELGEELNLVTDFTSGEDSLGLGDLTLDFDEIALRQAGADTVIGIGDRDIARLINVNASSLSAGDFILNSSPVLA